eukprot:TRINITY_DN7461_c0_g4_i1.p1 TRINITY_DN7461_c0_g4~~TRINITY_DN7461_c0_g4_i1.p1  ORF type:complete len:711 (+),score=252.79 TRINITY_DN7461_c0_g4_i1:87-2135(+)
MSEARAPGGIKKMLMELLGPPGGAAGGEATFTHKATGAAILVFFSAIFVKVNQPSKEKAGKSAGSRHGALGADLSMLVRILIPTWKCKEAFLLASFLAVLSLRTFLSITIAHMDGKVIKALVTMQFREFVRLAIGWLLIGFPAAMTNGLIKFTQAKLAQAFRTRLTERCYDLYLKDDTFYKAQTLDDRLSHPSQILTDDVARFSDQLADLISQFAKPAVDSLMFTWELWKSVGNGAVAGACFVTVVTAQALRAVRPPFGRLTAAQSEAEGAWRAQHAKLIENAEEIGFYRGAAIERKLLEGSYNTLLQSTQNLLRTALPYHFAEGYFTKYIWSVVGMGVCAAPVLFGTGGVNAGSATETIVTNRKLMTSAADSTERLMETFKEIGCLSGRSGRITSMLHVLREVGDGQFTHRKVGSTVGAVVQYTGKVEADEAGISFEGVPIVTPNGEQIVRPMTFSLRKGDHCLITGPNGCGKSSLFRVLAGLWPVAAGVLRRPSKGTDIYFLPQRAYLVQGTLRDQITYPDLESKMSDAQLQEVMRWACCEHVLTREKHGWETKKEWKDVLSGGERQKIGIARVFYHQPKFAILDECTSQIHVDDEELLYSKIKALGITLMSVSHRRSIWHHHSHALAFDSNGGVDFAPFGALQNKLTLEEERNTLARDLAKISEKQERLAELKQLLGDK